MYLDSPSVVFDRLARDNPEAPSVTLQDVRWTRGQIAAAAERAAVRLTALGVRRGDRVGIARRNAAAHLVLFLACARLGAVLVPLNFRLPAAECARILADAGCGVVVCGPRHADEFEAAGVDFPGMTRVVHDLDPTAGPASDTLPAHWHRWSEVPGDGPAPAPVALADDDLLMLQYTSGSTGRPKGVRQSLGTMRGSWRNYAAACPPSAFEVTLAVAPFGHVGGMHALTLQTLLGGGNVVVQRKLEVRSALGLVERERVRSTFGVPTMYEAISRHPDFASTDLSSLEVAMVGGASAPTELLELFRRRGVPMYHAWGMTETLGAGTVLPPEDYAAHRHSVGRACVSTQVRVCDPGGAEVPTGTDGELWVRGENVTDGYWGTPAGPESGFAPGGWLRTGDLARLDEGGWVELRGRAKDLIISGGENIHPVEIEQEIRLHPDVLDVCVVGVDNRRWGETPLAVVVLREDAAPMGVEDLRAFLGAKLARFKLPRYLQVTDALPTGPTGKVDRHALTEAAAIMYSPGLPWFPHHGDPA